jgi:hypothetical protein
MMTGAEVLNATDEQLAAATSEELAAALQDAASLTNAHSFRIRNRIMQEADRRKRATELSRPFNPWADVSADVHYLWNRIFIWFWVVPVVLGLIVYVVLSQK